MAKKNVVDAEAAVEEIKNKKFGLSIQNIIALVTVLSTGIAGWYSFTGRIDGLEETVQGFAETSDIALVSEKLSMMERDILYLRDKVDNLKLPKTKSYDKDVANLNNEIKDLKRQIKKLEKLLKIKKLLYEDGFTIKGAVNIIDKNNQQNEENIDDDKNMKLQK